jgi:hypothetical protein
MILTSHINEPHLGQGGRPVSGGFDVTILDDKGIAQLPYPDAHPQHFT